MAMQPPTSQQWSQFCTDAVRTTTECADWCIQNDPAQHAECIRRCLDARAVATAAASLVWREGPHTKLTLKAAAQALTDCAKECDRHRDMHDVMARCASTCNDAAQACATVAQQL